MALHISGPMHFSQIQSEFGGSGQLRLTQYYRAGGRVPNVARNYSISTGGRIAFSMFYGASRELSPDALAAAAGEGANAFSRSVHSGTDQPMPNSFWHGSYWSRETAGPYYIDWWFNNMGWAPTDPGSTIVFAGGGRGPGSVSISSVLKSDGTYAAFRPAYYSVWGGASTQWGTGASQSVYHCDCDRRDIVRVSSSWSTYSAGNRDTTMACFVLPSQMSIVNARRDISEHWSGIGAGDILVLCGSGHRDNDFNPSLQTHHSVIVGSTWYNYHYAGAIFGSSPRGWAIASRELTWPYTGVTMMIRLRRLEAGQGPASVDGLGGARYVGVVAGSAMNANWTISAADCPVWTIEDGSGLNGKEFLNISNVSIAGPAAPYLFMGNYGDGLVGLSPNGNLLSIPTMAQETLPYSVSAQVSTASGRVFNIGTSGAITFSQNSDNGGDGGA